MRSINFTRADQVEFKPTDWLIDGWLVKDTLAGLVAPSGACKSFLAIDWACRVATGSLWFGRNVKQGAVFYLAGEGRTGLRKRIAAWERHNGISIEGAPLFLADSLPILCEDYAHVGIINSIEDIAESIFFDSGCDPELIVIDTVARAMGGANENSSEDMGRLIRACDSLRTRWGATVLTVHHTGHDPNNQERGRGSSAYKAALDSEMVIKPGDPDFTLKATKAKDWAEPTPLTLRRVPVEIELPQLDGKILLETSLALHDATGAMVESKRQAAVIEMFRQGKSQREIAEETGTPRTTVQRWLKKAA
ncbi:AAA family ATPase [Dyella telluris]|uniref:AAA family ATPase n=1 Tax=Dyella telluris TaxID=2763498 RepID=A0A7G8Q1S3_9GAMM|nr:AAA family ATPase [Dyella telluris]QNK00731.1 AAA family ATPase [Dyella telluris]